VPGQHVRAAGERLDIQRLGLLPADPSRTRRSRARSRRCCGAAGLLMTVISHDAALLRTLPCPVPALERHRLRGARPAATSPSPEADPVTVQCRVSQRGQIMVGSPEPLRNRRG